MLLASASGAYIFGESSEKGNSISTVKSSPRPTAVATTTSSKPSAADLTKKVEIPSDWKSFTATDQEFGIKTTMSLPPNYAFSFTGSEFVILSNDANEVWD